MSPYDFVVWLGGVLETVGDGGPTKLEWELITTKLDVAGAWYADSAPTHTPNGPTTFPLWLRGFIDSVQELPTPWQWWKLRDVHGRVLANMARDKILHGGAVTEGGEPRIDGRDTALELSDFYAQRAKVNAALALHRMQMGTHLTDGSLRK